MKLQNWTQNSRPMKIVSLKQFSRPMKFEIRPILANSSITNFTHKTTVSTATRPADHVPMLHVQFILINDQVTRLQVHYLTDSIKLNSLLMACTWQIFNVINTGTHTCLYFSPDHRYQW